MDDAALVRVVDRLADGREEAEPQLELLRRHRRRALRQPLPERLAPHQLHGEEVVAVPGVAGLVDGGDVRVLEAAEDLRLAVEHAGVQVVDVVALAHHLEGDAAARVLLLGLPDDAHAALAEQADDLVLADRLRHRPRGCPAAGGAAGPESVGTASTPSTDAAAGP